MGGRHTACCVPGNIGVFARNNLRRVPFRCPKRERPVRGSGPAVGVRSVGWGYWTLNCAFMPGVVPQS